MTVTRGGRTGRPRCSPERAQDRRAHGGHRDAPWDGAPQLYKTFVLAAGRSAGGFLHFSPFFLSVWPHSRRTGRNTRHHWALACRTGRTSRRPAARHIVPKRGLQTFEGAAAVETIAAGHTQLALRWASVRKSRYFPRKTLERAAVGNRNPLRAGAIQLCWSGLKAPPVTMQ